MFVNPAPATAELATPPDPTPDRSAGKAPVPEGIARLLTLLRWIIGYGQQLATTLQQRTIGSDFARVASRYRTSDLAVILARIQRGLMLAAGLKDRLDQRAATGRDLKPVRPRYPTERERQDGNPRRKRAPRRTNIVDLPLDRLPTAEEIAIELRRRPAGAILADICRDLGILPGDLPRELQTELRDIILQYGGCLVVLMFKEARDQLRRLIAAEGQRQQAARAPAPPAPALPCPTGPP